MACRKRSRWTDGEYREWIQWGTWTQNLKYFKDVRLLINCGRAIWVLDQWSLFTAGVSITRPLSFCTSLGVNCDRFAIIWTLFTSLGIEFYPKFIIKGCSGHLWPPLPFYKPNSVSWKHHFLLMWQWWTLIFTPLHVSLRFAKMFLWDRLT